ncbi:uncharacterized protein [Haliotis asinina]|uniref:uncharacterized protein n=1 Tax=Haliotis asinina TaxID=109174 RepID=UPI0035327DA8
MATPNLPGSRSKSKRRHVETDGLSSSDDDSTAVSSESWPRFLVVDGIDGQPLKLNPFVISKAIAGICGEVRNVTRLRTGSLLVECAKRQQSVNLLAARQFANTGITVSVHKTLNSCRGVIRDRAKCLADMSEGEIASELKSQGVTSVKRFSRKLGDDIIGTNTYLFTFCLTSLPKSIKVGYFNIEVEVYIPSPLRCFKCQQFGHGARSCHSSPVCSRCSGKHENVNCANEIKCAKCNGDHVSFSKSCPAYERQAQILKLKHTNNISFNEAKNLLPVTSHMSSAKTYAVAVSTPCTKVDQGCQTAITWVSDDQTVLCSVSGARNGAATQTETEADHMLPAMSPTPLTTTTSPAPEVLSDPEVQSASVNKPRRLTNKQQKQLKKKETRALKHIEVSLPLTVPVEVHNTFEPLDMEVTPSLSDQRRPSPRARSPIEPP